MKKQLVYTIVLLLTACETERISRYTDQQIEMFTKEFKQYVTEKNNSFKNPQESPLLRQDLDNFPGLRYFSYNPEFRFEGPIQYYQIKDTIIIYGSKGDERPALKLGYFQFVLADKQYKLQIFKMIKSKPEYAKYLFLGFTDQTSNEQTYGAGRYIDLVENERNHYVVDFNYAYNPYCAYNPKYSCAIPGRENHLPFAIKAGEKKWHD